MALGCSPGFVKFNDSISADKIADLVRKALEAPSGEGESAYATTAKEIGTLVREETRTAHSKYCNVIEEYTASVTKR
jgi:hypothetical protein